MGTDSMEQGRASGLLVRAWGFRLTVSRQGGREQSRSEPARGQLRKPHRRGQDPAVVQTDGGSARGSRHGAAV